jgi:hypothetical protein
MFSLCSCVKSDLSCNLALYFKRDQTPIPNDNGCLENRGARVASKIFHAAIHDLRKTTETDFEVVVGKTNLRTGPTVQRVVDDLHNLYARRASKSHGKFSADTQ